MAPAFPHTSHPKCRKFSIPEGQCDEFTGNVESSSRESGIDHRLAVGGIGMGSTNALSRVVYQCYLDESFFRQFPKWSRYEITYLR